jgi:hypothetical protein
MRGPLLELGEPEICTSEISALEVRALEVGVHEGGSLETAAPEVPADENGLGEICVAEIAIAQVWRRPEVLPGEVLAESPNLLLRWPALLQREPAGGVGGARPAHSARDLPQ